MFENNLFQKREKALSEDLQILEGYINDFWEFLPIPVCSTNPALTILEVGSAFSRFFDETKEEIIGKNLADFFIDKQKFQEFLSILNSERKVANYEATLKKEASGKEVLFFAVARKDEEGEIAGYLVSFIDITSIKKTEAELQKRVQELENFYKITTNRELKMIELKNKLKEIEKKEKL